MPFSFFQSGSLADHARQLKLAMYTPALRLEGLVAGVDNVRHDVFLSPRFCELARQHLRRLLAKYGEVEELVTDEAATYRPPSVVADKARPKAPEPGEFKRILADLYAASLSRAKSEGNIHLDLLAHLAVLKFLKTELAAQFAQVSERCREKLTPYESPRHPQPARAMKMRERFAQFQVSKKTVLRRVGQELFQTQREVEKESLAHLRRSLFGAAELPGYELFLNRLLFTEEGRDDYLNAEHYVMFGNYERDPDRFLGMLELARGFVSSLHLPQVRDEASLRAVLSAPENAQELVAAGSPDGRGKAQKALLAAWLDTLEQHGVMQHVIASYEVVSLLAEYSPPINAQQLKNALISRSERKRVEELLEEHGRISPDNLHAAVQRVAGCRGAERAKMAGRFLLDLMRYHRDIRRLAAVNASLDSVNVIGNAKVRELSAINNTLYEFLLADEQKPAEDKVLRHVIVKADIRDSSALTRSLLERGLNPASHFSLNFYEPVNKLLPLVGATKVFIEGDAVILAILEHEGEASFAVARACVLAREIINIVSGYNAQSRRAGLPTLELGIGISYQDAPPLYLMDGSTRIMISPALNTSDRLASCSRVARRYLNENPTMFNVFAFQTVEDTDTGGDPDEFLVRYNIGGVHLDEAAFAKLQQEISLRPLDVSVPLLWGKRSVRLYSGMVPLTTGGFHPLVVRQGHVARIDARAFSLREWTHRCYYEVCTQEAVYEYAQSAVAASARAR